MNNTPTPLLRVPSDKFYDKLVNVSIDEKRKRFLDD